MDSLLKTYKAKTSISSTLMLENRQIKDTYDSVHNHTTKNDESSRQRAKYDPDLVSKKNRKTIKTITAQLNRIVNSGDSSHVNLEERRP